MKIKTISHNLSLFVENRDLVELTNALQLAKKKENDIGFLPVYL